MTLLTRLLSGAAVAALAAFSSFPQPVDALTTRHSGIHHVARHTGLVSAPHDRFKKRSSRKLRKRCATRPPGYTPPTTPDSAPKNGSRKVGIAWNDQTWNLKSFNSDKTGYLYTWSPWCPPPEERGTLKCAPMLWGWKQYDDKWKFVNGYADVILGFNEPDEHTQANMDVWSAAELWNQVIGPLRYQGYRLGSPATTGPGDRGLTWMHQFLPLIGEKPDFFALHWYSRGVDNFINYVERYHREMGGAKIWVTEFACQNFGGNWEQCTWDEVWGFMDGTTAWLDSTWYVEQYFYFGTLSNMYNVNPMNQLMGGDGRPNDLGWNYLT